MAMIRKQGWKHRVNGVGNGDAQERTKENRYDLRQQVFRGNRIYMALFRVASRERREVRRSIWSVQLHLWGASRSTGLVADSSVINGEKHRQAKEPLVISSMTALLRRLKWRSPRGDRQKSSGRSIFLINDTTL